MLKTDDLLIQMAFITGSTVCTKVELTNSLRIVTQVEVCRFFCSRYLHLMREWLWFTTSCPLQLNSACRNIPTTLKLDNVYSGNLWIVTVTMFIILVRVFAANLTNTIHNTSTFYMYMYTYTPHGHTSGHVRGRIFQSLITCGGESGRSKTIISSSNTNIRLCLSSE